jgi:hypothetical protein
MRECFQYGGDEGDMTLAAERTSVTSFIFLLQLKMVHSYYKPRIRNVKPRSLSDGDMSLNSLFFLLKKQKKTAFLDFT